MAGPGSGVFAFSVLGSGRYGTFFWGESRSVLERVLYAAVRAIDPEPLWLELDPSRSGAEEPGPVGLDWIPSDHVFLVDSPSAARPQSGVARMSVLHLLHADESDEAIRRLSDFVRLPPIAQEIIGQVEPGQRHRALAVANSDRVRAMYPETVDGVRPIVTSLLDAPIIPVLAAQGTPGPGRMAFDFVFEVRASGLNHWREGSLLPEKAPRGAGVHVGTAIPLWSIPGLDAAFASTPGRK